MSEDNDDLAKVILDAEYEGVRFPVAKSSAAGGHRGAEHEAYATDGADCESSGQKAYKDKLEIPFINGIEGFDGIELFPSQYLLFIDTISRIPIGKLTHPLLGSMTAWMHDWTIELSADVRNGVVVTVEITEHRATAQIFVGRSGEVPTDSTQALVSRADDADAEMATAMPDGGYTLTRPVVDTQLDALASGDAGQVASSSRAITDVCATNLALPGLSEATANAAILALERLRSAAVEVEASQNRGLRRSNSYLVPATMPLSQIAATVYGDASFVSRLRSANPGLIDPLFVPSGTVLIVPPAES